MSDPTYPVDWDLTRVQRVLEHYEQQDEDAAVAEDEVAPAACRIRARVVNKPLLLWTGDGMPPMPRLDLRTLLSGHWRHRLSLWHRVVAHEFLKAWP